MKKILLLCLVCIAIGAKAQQTKKLPLKDSVVVYEKTVEVAGTSDKLFAQAQEWVNDRFNNGSKSYVTATDKENLKLSGKMFKLYLSGDNGDVDTYLVFDMDIVVKNGSYNYNIHDIEYLYGNTSTPINTTYSNYLHGEIHKSGLIESKRTAKIRIEAEFVFADQYINTLLIGLKQAMSTTN